MLQSGIIPASHTMSYDPTPPIDPYRSPAYGGFNPPPSGANNQLAIASLAAGIAGLGTAVIAFCCCPLVGLPMPAIAIALGVMAYRDPRVDANGRTMAIIGIVCGAFGLIISITRLVLGFAMLGLGNMQPNRAPFR